MATNDETYFRVWEQFAAAVAKYAPDDQARAELHNAALQVVRLARKEGRLPFQRWDDRAKMIPHRYQQNRFIDQEIGA